MTSLEGDNLVVFYYFSVSEIWPYKRENTVPYNGVYVITNPRNNYRYISFIEKIRKFYLLCENILSKKNSTSIFFLF